MAGIEASGGNAHPNDDLLIALNDGVLFPGDRPLVEAHLKGCARCRARLIALTEDISVPLQPTSPPTRAGKTAPASGPMRRRLGVGIALLAILGTVGMLARRELIRRSAEPVALAPTPMVPERPAPAIDLPAPPAPESASPTSTDSPAASPGETATATDSSSVAPAGLLVVTSPNQDFRWRVIGVAVERTTNGGKDWQTLPVELTTPMAAGAAPSAAVCWLVGRGGAVFVGVGTNWKNVSLNDRVDLTRVSAIDSMNATVTAKDGRQFSTSDAGVTWNALRP